MTTAGPASTDVAARSGPARDEADGPDVATPSGMGRAHVEAARRLYALRRSRDRAFGPSARIFGEPSWDILLDLYHNQCVGRPVAVSASCVAGARSMTTAMRHIDRLEAEGLLSRHPDPTDRRRSWARLTSRGLDLMTALLDAFTLGDQAPGPARTARHDRSQAVWTAIEAQRDDR